MATGIVGHLTLNHFKNSYILFYDMYRVVTIEGIETPGMETPLSSKWTDFTPSVPVE